MHTLILLALLAAAPPTDDLQPIFNGKDLTGWRDGDNNKFWTVADGILIGQNDPKMAGNMLHTTRLYHDCIIEAQFRFTGEIDSGVMVRKPEIQAQIGISRSLKTDMTAMFYLSGKKGYPNKDKYIKGALKEGDWNTMIFKAEGNHFQTWLNGQQMEDFTDDSFNVPGPIGLQIHPGLKMKIEYRSVKVKELDQPSQVEVPDPPKPPKAPKPKKP